MILPGIGASGVGAVVASGGGSGGGVGSVSITNQSIIEGGAGVRTSTYRLNTTGAVQQDKSGAVATLETWLLSGAAADYDARVTIISGTFFSGTVGSWLNLAVTRDWTIKRTLGGTFTETTFTAEIRQAASPNTVLDSATIYLYCESY